MVKGIAIYPDKRVEDVEVSTLEEYQAIVDGLIEAVRLSDGSTMYVNEEYLFAFGAKDFNSIASDVCGLGGRSDLMLTGILGPVLLVGPVGGQGNDRDVTDKARGWVRRVEREAVL